jgi:hypothetical protein
MFPKISVRNGKINRLTEQNKALMDEQRKMKESAVLDVEEWISIVQSRTQALELLAKYAVDKPEVIEFLEKVRH